MIVEDNMDVFTSYYLRTSGIITWWSLQTKEIEREKRKEKISGWCLVHLYVCMWMYILIFTKLLYMYMYPMNMNHNMLDKDWTFSTV